MTTSARRRTARIVALVTATVVLAGCGAEPEGEAAGAPTASPATGTPSDPAPSREPSAPPATSDPAATPASTQPPTAAPAPSLPRGGRTLFPTYRLVGYAGHPSSEALGRLGVGDIDDRIQELERRARPYAGKRTILPVLELIATVASDSPGASGLYRNRPSAETIDEHLAAARRHDAMLLIGIQPGRADFLPEVKHYEKWLREPDVGVALDPEWAVGEGQVPGRVFGSTSGRELDGVAKYLAGIVAEHDLPEKAMVVHQLHVSIISDEARLRPHEGVVAIKSVDGIGTKSMKLDTNRVLTRNLRHVRPGFKLFYEEDRRHGPLMTPAEVMAVRPRPDYVLYE